MDAHFATFYEYFLTTKSWAYLLMFVTLPAFVCYWNFILYPLKQNPFTYADDCPCQEMTYPSIHHTINL